MVAASDAARRNAEGDTVQRDDVSVPNLVASGLFGDGASAVVAVGDAGRPGPVQVLDSRSRLYPDSERTMGFDVASRTQPVTSRTQCLHCIEPTESLTSGIALTFVERAFS